MKKILILATIVCAAFIANADFVYIQKPYKCPMPIAGYGYVPGPECYQTTAWASQCAQTAAVINGPGTVAYATGTASYTVVPPQAPTPIMYTTPAPTTVVTAPPAGPVYTVTTPGQTVVTAPTGNTTVITTPVHCHKRPLVGVNVLGLEVGVGY